MAKTPKVYLVVHPEETREAFETAMTKLGLEHFETRPGDGDRKPYEQVWATPDRTRAVNYLEDPLVGLRYLSLRCADPDELGELVTEVARVFTVEDGEDALELAVGAVQHDTQVEAINRLAITFPEFDAEAFRVFEAYATQPPHPLLRECAVNAMLFHGWPEFRPLLERVIAADPAETVRDHARAVLADLDARAGTR